MEEIFSDPYRLVLLVIYLVFFGLFLRYFYWMYYANTRYWCQRDLLLQAAKAFLRDLPNENLPFISILIPAKDEIDVIGNTIWHMASLNYPPDRFEIIVITDEKELLSCNDLQQTTPGVVKQTIAKLCERQGQVPAIKHVTVPFDYDGAFRGKLTGREVPSTKGRALNYGLQFVAKNSLVCGFYDAESRPEPDILNYVAWRAACDDKVQMWQGPVFQVRNFYHLSPLTKVAALYQAISHEWYLPVLMKRLPFVGGTNFFIRRQLLERLGGFDDKALTEDLEIGVRACVEGGAWPEYMPFCSTEQSPETLAAFFKQRLRWASGYLQVFDKLRKKSNARDSTVWRMLIRRLFWKGHFEWVLFQTATIVPFFILLMGYENNLHSLPLLSVLVRASAPLYFGFTLILYWRFSKYMDMTDFNEGYTPRLAAILELASLPLAGFFFPLPYSFALTLKAMGRGPQKWVKTPRTKEKPVVM